MIEKEQIDKLAREYLSNGSTNLQLARMALAADSHAATISTVIRPYREAASNEDAEAYTAETNKLLSDAGVSVENQDFLRIRLKLGPDEQRGAYLFPSDNLVIVTSESGAGAVQAISCLMTVDGFWRYMNSIPNIYTFAIPTRPMRKATAEGLQVLSEIWGDSMDVWVRANHVQGVI